MSKRTDTDDGFGELSQSGMSEYERSRLTKYGNQLKTNDQCIVIVKLVIHGKEVEQRKRVTECCATVANFGPLTEASQADIYPGDALWAYPVGKSKMQDMSPVQWDERNKVFASFDGKKTQNAKSRDEFKKWIKFQGIAKGHHFYSIEADNDGIAAIISGSTYVLNNSKTDIPSFQKVKYILPHPNEATRREEQKKYAQNKRFPCKRTMPILVCATNMKQRGLLTRTVIHMFRPNRSENGDQLISIRRLHPTQRASLTQKDYAAIALKRLLLQHTVHTLAVANRLGLIDLKLPRADSVSSYTSLDPLLSEDLSDYIGDKKRPKVEVDNGAGTPAVAANNLGPNGRLSGFTTLTEQDEKNTRDRLHWLALKTGLIHDSVKQQDSKFKESKALTDAFLLPTVSPYFSRTANAKLFDVRRLLNSNESADEGVMYHDVEGMYSPSTYGKQIAVSQQAALEDAVESFNLFKQSEDEDTVGMSLNHSAAGEYTQILL